MAKTLNFKWEEESCLGAGGFGTVYKVSLNRKNANKSKIKRIALLKMKANIIH